MIDSARANPIKITSLQNFRQAHNDLADKVVQCAITLPLRISEPSECAEFRTIRVLEASWLFSATKGKCDPQLDHFHQKKSGRNGRLV
jgi:hypothetical protein